MGTKINSIVLLFVFPPSRLILVSFLFQDYHFLILWISALTLMLA